MRRHMLASIIIFSLLVLPAHAQTIESDVNFTLTLSIGRYDQDGLIANYIKTSLAPLKINVEIGDQGDWYGKLTSSDMNLHNFGLWAARFQEQSEYPIKMWGPQGIAQYFYNYDNPEFLTQLLQDTEMTYEDIVEMEDAFIYADTKAEAIAKSNEFNQVFNEELLFAVPLVNPDPLVNLVSDRVNGYDNAEGLFGSIFRGMTMEDLPEGDPDNLTMQLFRSTSSAYGSVFSGNLPFAPSMFLVDSKGDLHPHMVKNVDKQDWVRSDGSTVPGGKTILTFYSGVNMSSDFGLPSSWETYELGPRDVLFHLQLILAEQYAEKFDFIQAGRGDEELELYLDDYMFEINDEARQLIVYEERPRVNSLEKLNYLHFLPERYLNGTFTTFVDSNINGTIWELAELGYSFWDTREWWSFYGGTFGLMLSGGPYQMTGVADGDWVVKQRQNYHFPNEWDTPDFMVHTPEVEPAYYFTYNATDEDPTRKATSFTIDTIEEVGFSSFWGVNSTSFYPFYQKLINGEYPSSGFRNWDIFSNNVTDMDLVVPSQLGKTQTYKDMVSGTGYSIEVYEVNTRSGMYLWFNPDSVPLQKLQVRKAIAMAIDRDAIANAINQFSYVVNYHPGVYPGMGQFTSNDHPIVYDFPTARDLMRSAGYNALESNEYALSLTQVSTNFIEITADDVFVSLLPVLVAVFGNSKTRNAIRKRNGT